MSDLKFVYASGTWRNAELPPKNDPEKYYIVTMMQKEVRFNTIPNNYWRYYNDRWEWYGDKEWHDRFNQLFEVVAYMDIVDIEPYEEGGYKNER